MKKWAKEHGLLLANIGLFLVFFCGMVISGASDYSEDQLAHGGQAVSIAEYLGTGAFLEATFENWESEFLQMGMYVILTVFLFQKGSSESKPMGKDAPQDQDPRDAPVKAATPWPVRRGGSSWRTSSAAPPFGPLDCDGQICLRFCTSFRNFSYSSSLTE